VNNNIPIVGKKLKENTGDVKFSGFLLFEKKEQQILSQKHLTPSPK